MTNKGNICYNNSMKIIQGVRQFYYRTTALRVRFLNARFACIFLNSNYLLRREIYVGIEWGAPSAIWKPLGFNRSTLYG